MQDTADLKGMLQDLKYELAVTQSASYSLGDPCSGSPEFSILISGAELRYPQRHQIEVVGK